eukprot:jgi/Mesvir1/1061/Mv25692-RA.1
MPSQKPSMLRGTRLRTPACPNHPCGPPTHVDLILRFCALVHAHALDLPTSQACTLAYRRRFSCRCSNFESSRVEPSLLVYF